MNILDALKYFSHDLIYLIVSATQNKNGLKGKGLIFKNL